MIAIDDLVVRFGGVTAINHLSISLEPPVIGVIGPNGAGKTTFLNVFSGFVTPASGAINAFGTSLLELPPFKRARWGLRRSFQKEQVVDELTVEENVRVVLDPLDLTPAERERQLASALDFCGLSSMRKSAPVELNALERRMTELARCLTGHPRVVLLDEPGAGLSFTEVNRLQNAIAEIHSFCGAMTLLIDHDVDLIKATCATSMVLDFGTLIAAGATSEVLTDPKVRAIYLGQETV